jgi:metallo-beta-lactamase class B
MRPWKAGPNINVRRILAAGLSGVLLAVVGLTAGSPSFRASLYSTVLQDDRPIAPFAITTDLYYVGSSDVAVYALQTTDGLILIGGGYRSAIRRVPENLRTLGLDPAEVRIILNLHAHVDHAASLAGLKKATGAELYASAEDAALLEAGGRGDFALGDWMTFPPVSVDHVVEDGEAVELGERRVTAHLTPGHTKGCTSWSFPIEADGAEVDALVICGLAALWFYRVTGDPQYPDMATDFERTFAALEDLPCELFLADHGKLFDLRRKRRALSRGEAPNPFLDPPGCRTYVASQREDFRARERGGGVP